MRTPPNSTVSPVMSKQSCTEKAISQPAASVAEDANHPGATCLEQACVHLAKSLPFSSLHNILIWSVMPQGNFNGAGVSNVGNNNG